ncbi:DUF1702 family protein [Streptomyces sp. NPDC090445]|uniref:DUF1702 family protein n=1 Tax=Streptomyces sp. NPDC090445 TaxID=3365963 RepID=UPI003822D082
MSANLRALRRRILTPGISATSLDVRGFHKKSPAAQELLETVGRYFLEGYGHAVEVRTTAELEDRLDRLPTRFRGFAYEGAAMGATVLDALPGSRGTRLPGLLAGHGRDHIYMAYVGIGWAMARLPRPLWPDLSRTDPLIRWLVLDGYGFHQAYFKTEKYVHGQYEDPRFAWSWGSPEYARRAVDQGIGRALWFVAGTEPDLAATLIEKFPEGRRADLFSGTGLAAAYACGAEEGELAQLARRAGPYLRQLQQGAAFAAEAREKAGLTIAQTEVAVGTLCGITPAEAAALCRATRPAGPVAPDGSGYEKWRQDIAAAFVSREEN